MEFQLKHFGIQQKHTAMKVGTDAICLGAWTACSLEKRGDSPMRRILDIGAGTAILSLMMAQTYQTAVIDAVELEEEAIIDAKYNINHSPWANRINLIHSDIREYVGRQPEAYDLIISNPPYFTAKTFSEDPKRSLARYDNLNGLGIGNLIQLSKQLLSQRGSLYFVAPVERLEDIRQFCAEELMLIEELCMLYGNPYDATRVLVRTRAYSGGGYTPTSLSKLIIRDEKGLYTNAYRLLVSPFLSI